MGSKKPLAASLAVSLAAFMEILDMTIINVALAHIAGDLGASLEESTWIVTSYLLTNAVVLTASGWCSEKFGRKRYFMGCIICFTMASFLCGTATSLPTLVFFRLLQGLAGGGLQPTQQAIIKDTFPPEKLGMAMSLIGIVNVCAPILGPALGGYITDNFSWRLIFFVNIPFGILATILVKKFVAPSPVSKVTSSIDYIGFGLLSVGLGTLQLALDNAEQYDWFDNTVITLLFSIAFLGLVTTIIWLLHRKHPIVNLRLFKIPSFSISCIMMFFIGIFVNVTTMLLPMLVQKDFGYSALTAGLIMVPGGILIMIMMPAVGKLQEHIRPKYLITAGMFISAVSMWISQDISLQSNETSFIWIRILQTAGTPFLFLPVMVLGFSAISTEETNNASAIISLMKNLGGSFGISLIISYLDHRQQIEQFHLTSHLTADRIGYLTNMQQYTAILQHMHTVSLSTVHAITHGTLLKIYQELQLQASILAYIDVFQLLFYIFTIFTIAALILPFGKKQTTGSK